jgi:hypothetical protein
VFEIKTVYRKKNEKPILWDYQILPDSAPLHQWPPSHSEASEAVPRKLQPGFVRIWVTWLPQGGITLKTKNVKTCFDQKF